MDENITINTEEQKQEALSAGQSQTTAEPNPQSLVTTEPAPDKKPEAVKTFTQEDLNRVGAKEKASAERAILKALGIEDKGEIENVKQALEDYRKEQEAKLTVSDHLKARDEQIAGLRGELGSALAELTTLKQMDYLRGQGVPQDEVDFYQFKISQLVTEDVDFEQATTEYLKERPVKKEAEPVQAPPPMYAGAGKAQVTATEADTLKAQYQKAQSLRNTAELSRLTRVAQEKGINLFS
jgi:Uncharacterized conserved protein